MRVVIGLLVAKLHLPFLQGALADVGKPTSGMPPAHSSSRVGHEAAGAGPSAHRDHARVVLTSSAARLYAAVEHEEHKRRVRAIVRHSPQLRLALRAGGLTI